MTRVLSSADMATSFVPMFCLNVIYLFCCRQRSVAELPMSCIDFIYWFDVRKLD